MIGRGSRPLHTIKCHSCRSARTLSCNGRQPKTGSLLLPHEEVDFEICLLIRQFNLLELDLSGEGVSGETSVRLRTQLVVVDPFLNVARCLAGLRVRVMARCQDSRRTLFHHTWPWHQADYKARHSGLCPHYHCVRLPSPEASPRGQQSSARPLPQSLNGQPPPVWP